MDHQGHDQAHDRNRHDRQPLGGDYDLGDQSCEQAEQSQTCDELTRVRADATTHERGEHRHHTEREFDVSDAVCVLLTRLVVVADVDQTHGSGNRGEHPNEQEQAISHANLEHGRHGRHTTKDDGERRDLATQRLHPVLLALETGDQIDQLLPDRQRPGQGPDQDVALDHGVHGVLGARHHEPMQVLNRVRLGGEPVDEHQDGPQERGQVQRSRGPDRGGRCDHCHDDGNGVEPTSTSSFDGIHGQPDDPVTSLEFASEPLIDQGHSRVVVFATETATVLRIANDERSVSSTQGAVDQVGVDLVRQVLEQVLGEYLVDTLVLQASTRERHDDLNSLV